MKTLEELLTKNPQYFGLLVVIVGVVMLISAIKGAKWLFEDDVSAVTYNMKKIDGLINMFGKKVARIIVGIGSVVAIIAGIVWFWIYAFYYNN